MSTDSHFRVVLKTIRTAGWFLLIMGGVVAVIAAFAKAEPSVGMALVVASVASWIGWGYGTTYVLGLRRHVRRHLRIGWDRAEVVQHPVSRRMRADLQIAVDAVRSRDARPATVFGVRDIPSLGHVVEQNTEPQPIVWEQFASGLGKTMRCARGALYLLRYKEQPYVAMVHPRGGGGGGGTLRQRRAMAGEGFELEVAAADRATAEAALAELLDLASEKSVHRGQVIALEQPQASDGATDEPFVIRFSDLPKVDRERIVLPDDVMRVVERNVLGLLQHRETLRRAGRSTRHGVLFHGPPGVGKTLVTKYLAHAVSGYTVILLTGRNLRFVRESCRLARLLAPSMVVMEDVDLVASERRKNRNTTLLHELMDEMDGLGPRGDVIFLLTTNRPEILEPALAARPGRVDQAIRFPLPDLDGRRRLFNLFSKRLDLSGVDVEDLLTRTGGASPAFIEELFRKAALIAAERGERSDPLRLTTDDFRQSLRELLEFGGELTRRLLGFDGDAAQHDRA